MLASAIGFFAIPFIKSSNISIRYFAPSALFVIIFSFVLYQFGANQPGLSQWLQSGKKHYDIQQQVSELGGFSGMIKQIKMKLATHPDDVEGWVILGKLYLANQEYSEAKNALEHAMRLRPDNPEIKRLYYQKAFATP
jgi:cytochrome c-type biogenesis protein CcmH/NrfG